MLPTKAGLYWAKSHPRYNNYNIIVRVTGESPFFKCAYWDLSRDEIRIMETPTAYIFGPELELPYINSYY
jgi:hypothetical protein